MQGNRKMNHLLSTDFKYVQLRSSGLGEASRPGAGDALQGRQRVHGGAPPAMWKGIQDGWLAGPTPEAQGTRVRVEGDALRLAESQVS